ncbi:related to alpha-1,2 glucosyltransferase/transcriptional activator [Phialocephala subalpina]|uniref:Dol-P-Glc:Glc(2)Man(9)GlcNAc(2)-PP-Dol alpha-1,2-glucosyltransferase n=1 Tax=Phialocephala subalpina TaxID=576137 RepID=A0A1L7XC33_9HELO|nr:related to alpha-1,2 glucosyltransferase/transcriptional activator [Phialocephala subalpina]
MENILPWSLVGLAVWDSPFSPNALFRSVTITTGVVYLSLYLLTSFWQRQVTEIVPEPYLDEVFHIPQSQAYCVGAYDIWDPKLTTPPGLYVFATLFSKLFRSFWCSPYTLRLFNVFSLIMTMSYASDCRSLITQIWKPNPALRVSKWIGAGKPISSTSLHTSLNIALFPLLFFFSGLFYTDVLSTCIVLRMYRLFLERKGAYTNSHEGLVWMYFTGLVALTMRQTNIFWVSVFMGGLELVRTIKITQTASVEVEPAPGNLKETILAKLKEYSHGEIHDIPLRDASVHDFVLCAISIAVAALFRPLILATRLWPYVALLTSFSAFVVWNGGVVLGDKENHVATIHLPQMLYIWPLVAFFSLPLIIPVAFAFLQSLTKLLALPLFPKLFWKYVRVATYTGLALEATLVVIKFNTIIHPFTLADNRHYMFYVFRYSILRHPLVRYLLAPVYLGCAYLIYLTLCVPEAPNPSVSLKSKQASKQSPMPPAPTNHDQEGPKTSFVLILLVTTTLSLVTAPLVEPRYFIIPWVIWRLNVPSFPIVEPGKRSKQKNQGVGQKIVTWIKFWGWEGHDYRLWLETTWFLVINFITGYMFLYRGFEWKQEPGNVQRFMW